jgi:D-alanyl-D-alanine carboxypeptidase
MPARVKLNMPSINSVKRLAVMLVMFAFAATSVAQATPQFSTITVDARTGAMLYQKDADGLRHPASLTKMMTLYVLFQDLKSGRIKRSTMLRVSSRAASMAPSKLGLKAGSTISVDDAIKALVTKSANDVAATIGENLGGTESNFAARMTRVAHAIGMSRSTFYNASGLPNPKQYTTARDMGTLGLRLMRDFPQYYPYFRITAFNFKGRTIRSHNRLVGRFDGTDGIKTGYTAASGYNLVTSTRRGDKRLVGVVLGARSTSARNSYMMVMLEKMFPKAKAGSTVAALAGSSKGVINPLSQPTTKPVAVAAAEPNQNNNDQLAKAAEAASQGPVEQGGDDDETQTASTDEPKVLQADLAPVNAVPPAKKKTPTKLPFQVKSAAAPANQLTDTLAQSWNIQIGAFPKKSEAQAKLTALRGTTASALADKPAFTLAVKNGSQTLYRARFAGFDQATAKQACAQIAKLGEKCVLVSPAT